MVCILIVVVIKHSDQSSLGRNELSELSYRSQSTTERSQELEPKRGGIAGLLTRQLMLSLLSYTAQDHKAKEAGPAYMN